MDAEINFEVAANAVQMAQILRSRSITSPLAVEVRHFCSGTTQGSVKIRG